MKTRQEILNKLKSLIEEQTLGAFLAANIGDGELMRDDLGLDSLDYATVFLECEKWLGIKVKESGINWATIQTVEQIATLLEGAQ